MRHGIHPIPRAASVGLRDYTLARELRRQDAEEPRPMGGAAVVGYGCISLIIALAALVGFAFGYWAGR